MSVQSRERTAVAHSSLLEHFNTEDTNMPKGMSIHIGLNRVDPDQYEGWDGALNACEADALSMRKVAEARGYGPPIMLRNKEATAAAVINSVGKAAQTLEAGDILLLTYSGHGAQVDDLDGDEDDGLDETWVLYDRMLIDDEWIALWGEFKPGVRIVVVSDSCHSGTATKQFRKRDKSDERGRQKLLPHHQAMRVFAAHKDVYMSAKKEAQLKAEKPIKAEVILLSACQDNQTTDDGEINGRFTESLLTVWNNNKFDRDYPAFHQAISKLMPSYSQPNYLRIGNVTPAFEGQVPFFII